MHIYPALQPGGIRSAWHVSSMYPGSSLHQSSRHGRPSSHAHAHGTAPLRSYISHAVDPATDAPRIDGPSSSEQQPQAINSSNSSSIKDIQQARADTFPYSTDVGRVNNNRGRGGNSSRRGRGKGAGRGRGVRSSSSDSSSSSSGNTEQHNQQQQQQQQSTSWQDSNQELPQPGQSYSMRRQQQADQPQQKQQKQQKQKQQPLQQEQQQQQQWWGGRQHQYQKQQQQQPLLLFQGSSASQAQEEAVALANLLIAKISSSKDLQQLAAVLALHEGTLNPKHLSAAISRAAKLHPGQLAAQQQQQQQQEALQQLVSDVLQQFISQLQTASFVEVSCVIGGLARLHYNTPRVVIDACLDATRDYMTSDKVTNKELLQLAWGLARLAQKPDDAWLAVFEQATYNRMHTFNNIETANVLWVFAKWAAPPPGPWLTAWLSHLPSQLLTLQPPELSSIVWAAAMLQLQLPTALVDGLLLEAQVKFSVFAGQGFGTLAWALARMDIKPNRLWLQEFVRHCGSVLASLPRDQPFTNIIWALGCWEHSPPTPWLQEFCRCVVPQLGNMTPQGLAIIAVGLAELNHRPPQPFVSYLLELFHKQLAAATAAQAAAFVWALPRLLLQTQRQAAAALPQQQQKRFAPGGWIRQFCWLLQDIADHILPGLEKLSATELVDVISGFADLGFFPGVAWMDAHEASLNRRLDQLSVTQVNLVKQAYLTVEQQQAVQQRLLHPEQLKLLQQQQQQAAATAVGVAGVRPAPGAMWKSSNSLQQSAAAAAAATAAEKIGVDATMLGNSSLPASVAVGGQQSGSSSSSNFRNRRLDPPAWASKSSSSSRGAGQQQQQRGRGHGRRGRGRGRGGSNSMSNGGWDDAFSDDCQETLNGLGVSNQPPGLLPQMPNKPRAARIRLQKIRQAERQEREQEKAAWRQRWEQQQQQSSKWRVAKPGEFTDEE